MTSFEQFSSLIPEDYVLPTTLEDALAELERVKQVGLVAAWRLRVEAEWQEEFGKEYGTEWRSRALNDASSVYRGKLYFEDF